MMKIYNARLSFELVQDGHATAVDDPQRVVEFMQGSFDEDPTVEWFFVIPLNRKNFPMGRIVVTKGIATASLVHPREVFRPVILAGATAAIVCHNHPSGDPDPSAADIAITKILKKAGEALQIDLLDHIIMGDPGNSFRPARFYSFADAGLL
jgi:DNA repair protein RadC